MTGSPVLSSLTEVSDGDAGTLGNTPSLSHGTTRSCSVAKVFLGRAWRALKRSAGKKGKAQGWGRLGLKEG